MSDRRATFHPLTLLDQRDLKHSDIVYCVFDLPIT